MSDQLTPDPGRKSRMHWLRDAWKRQDEESTTIFAVLMAGVAMLFIAGIVTAFISAKDNAEERAEQQNAERAAASATATPSASGGADGAGGLDCANAETITTDESIPPIRSFECMGDTPALRFGYAPPTRVKLFWFPVTVSQRMICFVACVFC